MRDIVFKNECCQRGITFWSTKNLKKKLVVILLFLSNHIDLKRHPLRVHTQRGHHGPETKRYRRRHHHDSRSFSLGPQTSFAVDGSPGNLWYIDSRSHIAENAPPHCAGNCTIESCVLSLVIVKPTTYPGFPALPCRNYGTPDRCKCVQFWLVQATTW